jgi:hypothetical protein
MATPIYGLSKNGGNVLHNRIIDRIGEMGEMGELGADQVKYNNYV